VDVRLLDERSNVLGRLEGVARPEVGTLGAVALERRDRIGSSIADRLIEGDYEVFGDRRSPEEDVVPLLQRHGVVDDDLGVLAYARVHNNVA
jgi:hypothetical protein